jgi:Na+/melibiose symporter-like transporter
MVMLGASHLSAGSSGLVMMSVGFVFVLFFGIWETRTPNPLIDISMLAKNKFFTLSCFAAMVSYAATFGLTFFMSLYLQYVMGLSPHSAGFMLLLQPVTQMAVSPMVGRVTDRIAPVKLANFGIGAISIGLVLIALTIGKIASLPLIAVDLVLIGAGFGVFITPNTVAIMGSVGMREYGMASGMIGTMRTLGMVTSMTTITLVFSLLMGTQPVTNETIPAFISSMQVGLFSFAVFSLLGVTLSLRRGLAQKRSNPAP